VETEFPAAFELAAGGQLPAFSAASRGSAERRIRFRHFAERRPPRCKPLPEDFRQAVRFFSDRVLFLSSVAPAQVREVPLLGTSTPFPWRRTSRPGELPSAWAAGPSERGSASHSYSSLEFACKRVTGPWRRRGARRLGGPRGGRRLPRPGRRHGDLQEELQVRRRPEALSLPVQGVGRIRLEVDYARTALDFGDFADWADLRVTPVIPGGDWPMMACRPSMERNSP